MHLNNQCAHPYLGLFLRGDTDLGVQDLDLDLDQEQDGDLE